MTRAKQIEKSISNLWQKFEHNPFALLAIAKLQDMRSRDKGWLYEDELPEGYDYNANFGASEVRDGVRMFPAHPENVSQK
jgi:hypothetical protein